MAEKLLRLEKARAGQVGGLAQPSEHRSPLVRADSEEERRPDEEANESESIADKDIGTRAAATHSAAIDEDVPLGNSDTGRDVAGTQSKAKTSEEEPRPEAVTAATVGQKVRQRRWMMGITKSALAARIGITAVELQSFELGLTHLDTSRLEKLAEALEVSMTYFVEDEKPLSTADDRAGHVHQGGLGQQPSSAAALARTA
jgi:ribosome-binding protein aMBF1 (putative translation factor)